MTNNEIMIKVVVVVDIYYFGSTESHANFKTETSNFESIADKSQLS